MSKTKPNYCTWHSDWTNVIFEWLVFNYFGNPSKWTRSRPKTGQKLKWSKNKWKNPFLYSFWKAQPQGRCNRTQCTSSVTSLIFRRTVFPCYTLTTFIIKLTFRRTIFPCHILTTFIIKLIFRRTIFPCHTSLHSS